jgi:hypothetical protein
LGGSNFARLVFFVRAIYLSFSSLAASGFFRLPIQSSLFFEMSQQNTDSSGGFLDAETEAAVRSIQDASPADSASFSVSFSRFFSPRFFLSSHLLSPSCLDLFLSSSQSSEFEEGDFLDAVMDERDLLQRRQQLVIVLPRRFQINPKLRSKYQDVSQGVTFP